MLTQEQQIFEQIKKAQNILITFSKSWDGDAVASSLALFLYLKRLDKNVEVIADTQKLEKLSPADKNALFSFLPSYNEIKNSLENLRKFIISLDISNTKVSQIKYARKENALNFIISPKEGFFTNDDITSRAGEFKYDLIIVLDTPDLESLEKIYDNDTEFFYKVPIINIDHHAENEEFGQINYVELKAVSTSEILFSLFESYSRDIINEDIATCLLAGIIYQTKSFKTSNITPRTLLTTSQLISMGARREEIVNRLYRSRSLNVLKLWGRVLARLSSTLNNKLVWTTLTPVDFIKTESGEKDLIDVIDELIVSIPQAYVIIIIYETKLKQEIKIKEEVLSEDKLGDKTAKQETAPLTNVIVYTTKNINLFDLVKKYNPAGTKKLVKIFIDKELKKAEEEIIEFIKNQLNNLPL